MVDDGNAAALVAALLDLVRAGEADLTDVETADLQEVMDAVSRSVSDRLGVAIPGV